MSPQELSLIPHGFVLACNIGLKFPDDDGYIYSQWRVAIRRHNPHLFDETNIEALYAELSKEYGLDVKLHRTLNLICVLINPDNEVALRRAEHLVAFITAGHHCDKDAYRSKLEAICQSDWEEADMSVRLDYVKRTGIEVEAILEKDCPQPVIDYIDSEVAS